jgi:hypothetical protein
MEAFKEKNNEIRSPITNKVNIEELIIKKKPELS